MFVLSIIVIFVNLYAYYITILITHNLVTIYISNITVRCLENIYLG